MTTTETTTTTKSPCSWKGCTSETAHFYDADGDEACAEHAAKSESWVVIFDATTATVWQDEEIAGRITQKLEEIGYAKVTIRAPRRGGSEYPGIFVAKDGGGLSSGIDSAVREHFAFDLDRETDRAI